MTAARRAPWPPCKRLGRALAAAAMLLAAIAVAACGSDGGSMGSHATAPTSTGASGKPLVLDDAANGTTVTLTRGERVTVTLHSTSWQLAPPADVHVLAVGTPPAARPDPSCRSIPGTGCGTVTAVYKAAAAGTTMLTAHRDSCGEALRCTGGNGDWTVTIRVSR